MSRYVLDLRCRAAGDPGLTGGKGAGLNRLMRAGFNVPPGFVIMTRAFRDFLAALPPECAGLDAAVLAAPMPPTIRREVLAGYTRLGGPVAVRSSAVAEDAADASHAGQFETWLDVTGEDRLLDAVRACWASLFASRAEGYLARHGSGEDVMAVVVQRMARGIAAGVAFTADPITGQPCVVVEAAAGLGTAVVGGATRPDRYVVDGRGVLAEATPVLASRPVLCDTEILALAHLAVRIERLAGGPQDIEWAWDGAAFHILQARPIAALQERHVYSRRIVADMAPGLVKPLVYDVNTLAKVREVFGALFAALLGTHDFDTSRFVALLHSRVYADMTELGEMLVAAGLPANLFEVMLRDERSTGARMHMDPHLLSVALRMVPLVFRAGRLGGRQARQVREGRHDLEPFRTHDWSVAPLPGLLADLDTLIARRDRFLWFFFCSAFNSAIRMRLLAAWVARKAPDVAFDDLIRGLAGLKSLEPSLELLELAQLACSLDDEARVALAQGDDAVRSLLSRSAQGRVLLAGVDAFLERHGYLSSNGSDFSSPSWKESPALIWRSIGRGVASEAARQQPSGAEIRAAACSRVRSSVGPLDRWIFGRLLAGATSAIDLRERSSVLISQFGYEMRRLFMAAAGRLVASGCLATAEDVFYLAYGELQSLAAGGLAPEKAAAYICERRAALVADAAIDPPEVIVATPGQPGLPVTAHEQVDGVEYLTGIGGSPGLVRGIARVVHDPIDAPAALGRTDILVVPFSDVGWTPLFAGIGGIVAETGGQLSHAAIVAREYNLPAVVSVRDATRRISDGQPLTLDGSQGRVYLRPEIG